MASRRRRAKRESQDRIRGIFLMVFGLALIAGLGGLSWWLKTTKVALGPDNCPVTGPRAVHVIMIDQSDPISGQQAQQIREYLSNVKKHAAFGTRFDIYTFEGNTKDELKPKLSVCAPGKPEEANELIENPERIKRTYDQKFSAQIDASLESLLHASTLPTSPIIESIRAASITSFAGSDVGSIPLHLTLISDMIQHSAAYSQFRADSNFEALSKTSAWAGLRPQLKGVEIDILYLLRNDAKRNGQAVQNRGHQEFWEQLINASGGQLTSIRPL